MPIPGHGPFCKTRSYPTRCKYCGQNIFFVSCTCGSTMLFDHPGWPWPKHWCVSRGASGRSGSGAAQGGRTSRRLGAGTKHDQQRNLDRNLQRGITTRRVEPQSGGHQSLLADVMALHAETKLTKKVNAILQSGMRLSNLDPRSHYGQITLVETRVRPNKSYTALIPDDLARGLPTNVTAKVEIRGMPIANMRCWIVTDISTS